MFIYLIHHLINFLQSFISFIIPIGRNFILGSTLQFKFHLVLKYRVKGWYAYVSYNLAINYFS